MDFIGAWRAANVVRRYHTCFTLKEQTIASHQHGVALLIIALHPNPSPALLVAALVHDIGEHKAGDSPFSAKKSSLELRLILKGLEANALQELGIEMPYLDKTEAMWLQACDTLECMLYAHLEYDLGNLLLRAEVLENVGKWYRENRADLPDVLQRAYKTMFRALEIR